MYKLLWNFLIFSTFVKVGIGEMFWKIREILDKIDEIKVLLGKFLVKSESFEKN